MSMTAALMSSLLLFNFGPIFWIAMIIIGIVLVRTHEKTLKTLKNKFVIPGSLPSLAAIIIAAVISILSLYQTFSIMVDVSVPDCCCVLTYKSY